MWIDGALTHAIREQPRFDGEDERVSAALAIADDEHRVAEAAGAPRVMELALIEPSLHLSQRPPALARLVAAIVRRLRAG